MLIASAPEVDKKSEIIIIISRRSSKYVTHSLKFVLKY